MKQSGSVTPGHIAVWASTGVIEDGGPTQPPPPKSNVVEMSGVITPTHLVKWATSGVIEDGGSGGTFRGNWVTNTQYFYLDFVYNPVNSTLYSVTQNYVSSGSINTDISNGNLVAVFNVTAVSPTVTTQSGTSYTIQQSDNNTIISFSNSSPVTVTLPNNLSQGFNCILQQEGTGQVGVVAASGATLHSANGDMHLNVQYSTVYLFVLSNPGTAAQWRMSGDMGT